MEKTELNKKVEEAIEKIRPRLQMDGGDVKFIEIEDGVVKLELQGACKGCPMSQITLYMGIERAIKKEVPEIKGVEDINSNFPPEMIERFRQFQNVNE